LIWRLQKKRCGGGLQLPTLGLKRRKKALNDRIHRRRRLALVLA